ncbi:MAG TPA: imidazoleglycerol-phosphate dehydratase HisB [Armatimonadota bacterium]|jgi:imidazoleglycerol-phosphate dehydratase|nr:imidazoleglycerol-phosphate dehydratase HisB [Armatimonadota bacterium]HOP78988.1 imidazoleglycerol-phosphate dehydratase HisB [Armatimonadota bacterium]
MSRTAEVHRKTKETDVRVKVELDGSGESAVSTGVGFFDHMLDQIARHSLINLDIKASGDLVIDPHHTVEDVGITLGQAIDEALGTKEGILRYGSATVPMDESLVMTSIDISGRGHLEYSLQVPAETIGEMPADLVEEFFTSLARSAKMTIHIRQISGTNPHHIVEAAFKSFARSLGEAISKSERIKGVPSTKGTL